MPPKNICGGQASKGTSEDHVIKIELDQRQYYKFRNPITLCEYVESNVHGLRLLVRFAVKTAHGMNTHPVCCFMK